MDRSEKTYWTCRAYKYASCWTCENCGLTFFSKDDRDLLHVHHIDQNHNNNNRDNLKALCVLCHSFEHPHLRKKRGFMDDLARIGEARKYAEELKKYFSPSEYEKLKSKLKGKSFWF